MDFFVAHPRFFYFLTNLLFYVAVFIGLIGSFWGAYGIRKDINGKLEGIISGRVFLEDISDKTPVEIVFYSDKGLLPQHVNVNSDGTYSAQLFFGSYKVVISAKGYQSVSTTARSYEAQFRIEDSILKLVPKRISLTLVDRKNDPFSNQKLAILKGTSGNAIYIQTDSEGRVIVDKLPFGEYNIWQADANVSNDPRDTFIWIYAQDRAVGNFVVDNSVDSKTLRFSRVIFRDLVPGSSIGTTLKDPPPYLAQPFTLDNDIEFCGMGFGVGIGLGMQPDYLSIHADLNGSPAKSSLFKAKPLSYPASITSGNGGSYAEFCVSTPFNLPKGRYWAIATNTIPKKEIVVGGRHPNISRGTRLRFSVDGDTWQDLPPGEHSYDADIFITR